MRQPVIIATALAVTFPSVSLAASARLQCNIEVRCAGVWSECVAVQETGHLTLPDDGSEIIYDQAGHQLVFEPPIANLFDQGLSVSGFNADKRTYANLVFKDGQLGIITSRDSDDDGSFYASGSFAGTCKEIE